MVQKKKFSQNRPKFDKSGENPAGKNSLPNFILKKTKTQMNKGRNFFITLNNPTETDHALMSEFANWDNFRFLIYQIEEGEEDLTPHIQGTLCFKNERRKKMISDQLRGRAHVEFCNNVFKSINYCRKAKTKIAGPWEYGENPIGQGHRSDFDEIIKMAKEQKSYKEILEKFPGTVIRNQRNIQNTLAEYCKPRDFKSEVIIYYGKSGTGKTRRVFEENNKDKIYKTMVSNGTLYLDGYEPNYHEIVLFDDFYGGIKWTELLQLMDRYPHRCHLKGSSVQWKPKKIYFTSNTHPSEWYPNQSKNPVKWEAFTRRIDKIENFTNINNVLI